MKGSVLMNQKVIIRNEEQKDRAVVDQITRQAFYNLYVPGCVEHYLVHIMREHEDFISELDFVLELNGNVIGNIMYTKAKLIDENGNKKDIVTFGPVSIHPAYQRMGYGKMLMEHSFRAATQLGYDTIVIFGSPSNYVSRGFKSCKKYDVCIENGKCPAAMMVKELVPHVLEGHKWIYQDSPVMAISEEAAKHYDDTLEPMEKRHLPSQEEFYIMSQAFIEE
jgi:putative acetyltransferase